MSFELERFVSLPTLQEINSLKKANLLTIAQHYKLSVNDAMTKAQIKKSIVQYLHDEEHVSDEEDAVELDAMSGEELLQLKQLELQEKEKEREVQLQLKEFKYKEKELAM